ncbi:MAG: SpoIID/LytB domain-containing protein [Holophagales bacterium]|jgi:stage II sporulation protein D|nr:SpoIID/LytB domain-containing protein [Holophagales bacterium]
MATLRYFFALCTLLFALCFSVQAQAPAKAHISVKPKDIRIGLSLEATEHVISLEGGGSVCTRAGKPLIRLRGGERLRIWLDTRGQITSADEYRVQIGPPLAKKESDALIQQIKKLGESPESVKLSDGDTWRILLGRFATLEDAEPLLEKLSAGGFEELWVTSEKRTANPKNSRGGLYGITERHERVALPSDGVLLKPSLEASTVEGKGAYRGRIEIYPNAQNRLSVINTLDMESYLRGVVPKEMGAWIYPAIEALKAQAVAARTYAYANLGKRSKNGFDLLDTPLDQVYGGKDGEQNLTDRAVAETRGLIATMNGRPIQTLYMATGGGATIDNTHVFGGGFSYLKGVSSYPNAPQTLLYKGIPAPSGSQSWLSWNIARLVAEGLLPTDQLNDSKMFDEFKPGEIKKYVTFLTNRFKLPASTLPTPKGTQVYIWMAKSLNLHKLIDGIERPLAADYFLQDAKPPSQDRILAGFLSRLGIVSPLQWRAQSVTTLDALQVLARIWAELEPMDLQEGVLLRDGQVRPRQQGPTPIRLGTPLLVLEEYPGGYLCMVGSVNAQVGDKVKWLNSPEGGSRLFVRRLDPDGASYDRYNPAAHWKLEISEADLVAKLRSRSAVRSLKSIDLTHNENGRVTEMIVRDQAGGAHRFTGMRIRGALGLRDNVFRFITTGEPPDRKFIFYGRGWGHGVGMDQTGAYGMALEGFTFEQILKHYYRGVTIQPIGN